MYRSSLLWVMLCCLFSADGQSTTRMPPVFDVAKRFHESYLVDNEINGYVTFEKRKEGWYVVSNRYENYSLRPFKKDIFYDVENGKYQKIDFNEAAIPREFNISDYVDEWSLKNFDLHPYFGYRGWYLDVINELEQRKNLSDSELYSLGRAYSSKAYNLFSNQGDDAIVEDIWPLRYSINCFSDKQVEIFSGAIEKSQKAFKRLYERNPEYETAVGKIGIKYANEAVVRLHILLVHAIRHASKMQLPDNLYPDSILQPLRNILMDCPKTAILMSFSDNDFYPVLYLQQKEKLRQDVHLVNYSLFGIDRYIFRATRDQFKSPGIKIAADTGYYDKKRNEIIYVESGNEPIEFSQVRTILKNGFTNVSERITINATSILLNKNGNGPGGITLPLENARYLFKNHWVILDMIENLGDRKLCLTGPFYDQLAGLNEYLVQKGTIWVLK